MGNIICKESCYYKMSENIFNNRLILQHIFQSLPLETVKRSSQVNESELTTTEYCFHRLIAKTY